MDDKLVVAGIFETMKKFNVFISLFDFLKVDHNKISTLKYHMFHNKDISLNFVVTNTAAGRDLSAASLGPHRL